jgi:putative N6-adenine-specific DNA methylase
MQNKEFLKPEFEITAKSLKGFEQILANEIKELGGKDINIQNRAVRFKGNKKLLYKANLHLRTALRILVPIWKFKVRNENDLYKNVKNIYWDKYLTTNNTFAIDAIVNSDLFNHSKYISYKTKDAIADFFRDKFGKRPNVDIENPDLKINVHISKDFCTVSLDSSGTSLNQRDYRRNPGKAPLNEVLAAGIIMQSNWDKSSNLIDLMCGSGTFLIEATMMALNIPPNFYRTKFGFENWNNFDRDLWSEIIYQAKSKRKKKIRF